jgi:hypothetical protein
LCCSWTIPYWHHFIVYILRSTGILKTICFAFWRYIFSEIYECFIIELLSQVTGRRDRAKPLPFKMESSGAWGYSGANSGNPRITAKFEAPCYALNKLSFSKLPQPYFHLFLMYHVPFVYNGLALNYCFHIQHFPKFMVIVCAE